MAEPYAGIAAADRSGVETLNEVSRAIRRAVEAVKHEPGRLAGAFSAGSYPVEALDDIVRIALRAAVPDVLDQAANLAGQRDRAVRESEILAGEKHQHWLVANRLRGALAVATAELEQLRAGNAGGESRG